MDKVELLRRANEYATRTGLTISSELGAGVHGIVFAAKSKAEGGEPAIKVHDRETCYQRERDVYLRLQDHGLTVVRGCNVPKLLGYDDELLVIEMTIVVRPFVLDFGGAYLDHAPEFSDEVMAEWEAEKAEQFESRWPEVRAILRELESYGVFVLDVNPGNISFGD